MADIIVSENGTLVAEDIWHGFDEGAREAISEYLEENGATVYDLMNIPDQATVILADGTVMKIMEQQSISTDTWEPTLTGQNQQGEGYVFTAESTGKSAGLKVMTGIRRDGTISGVAVTSDNETAGYVDKVEKGGLLTALQGKNAKALEFGVDVDGVSQATKTSKGIVNAVNQAIAYFDQVTAVQKDDTAWQTKGESGT